MTNYTHTHAQIQWEIPVNPGSIPDLTNIVQQIYLELKNKVLAAYLFGSVAKGNSNLHSDIDLIVVKETTSRFHFRTLEFEKLFDIYPQIDLLVYTPKEFKQKLEGDLQGFWKEIKNTKLQII